MYNPNDPHYAVDQLLQSDLQDHLPSVKIVVYSRDDVTVKDFSNKKPYNVQLTYTE